MPDASLDPENKKLLELDGYCEEYEIAFEFDGPMHSEPIFGVKILREHIKRDLIKNELCDKNSVRLIRIPYKVKDIEKYLKKKLKKIWPK